MVLMIFTAAFSQNWRPNETHIYNKFQNDVWFPKRAREILQSIRPNCGGAIELEPNLAGHNDFCELISETRNGVADQEPAHLIHSF
jgi:hypothetical protein